MWLFRTGDEEIPPNSACRYPGRTRRRTTEERGPPPPRLRTIRRTTTIRRPPPDFPSRRMVAAVRGTSCGEPRAGSGGATSTTRSSGPTGVVGLGSIPPSGGSCSRSVGWAWCEGLAFFPGRGGAGEVDGVRPGPRGGVRQRLVPGGWCRGSRITRSLGFTRAWTTIMWITLITLRSYPLGQAGSEQAMLDSQAGSEQAGLSGRLCSTRAGRIRGQPGRWRGWSRGESCWRRLQPGASMVILRSRLDRRILLRRRRSVRWGAGGPRPPGAPPAIR